MRGRRRACRPARARIQCSPCRIKWIGREKAAGRRVAMGIRVYALAEAGGMRQRRDVDLDNSGSVFASPGRSERSGDASRSTRERGRNPDCELSVFPVGRAVLREAERGPDRKVTSETHPDL